MAEVLLCRATPCSALSIPSLTQKGTNLSRVSQRQLLQSCQGLTVRETAAALPPVRRNHKRTGFRQRDQPPARRLLFRCQGTAESASETQPAVVGGQPDLPPPGCSRVKLTLGKPLGMVLEEDKAGNILVAEVFPDGNASKSGLVDVGDQLIAVSALIYNTSEKYGEVEVRKGQEKVRLNVRGESFNTVMAAIGSHPAYIKVDLEIQKCEPVRSSSKNGT